MPVRFDVPELNPCPICSPDLPSGGDELLAKRPPTFVVRHRVGGVRDRRTSVADKVVDPVGAVARWVEHPADDPFRFQDALLDKTLKHLLDLRAEPHKYWYLRSKGCLVMSGVPR